MRIDLAISSDSSVRMRRPPGRWVILRPGRRTVFSMAFLCLQDDPYHILAGERDLCPVCSGYLPADHEYCSGPSWVCVVCVWVY